MGHEPCTEQWNGLILILQEWSHILSAVETIHILCDIISIIASVQCIAKIHELAKRLHLVGATSTRLTVYVSAAADMNSRLLSSEKSNMLQPTGAICEGVRVQIILRRGRHRCMVINNSC